MSMPRRLQACRHVPLNRRFSFTVAQTDEQDLLDSIDNTYRRQDAALQDLTEEDVPYVRNNIYSPFPEPNEGQGQGQGQDNGKGKGKGSLNRVVDDGDSVGWARSGKRKRGYGRLEDLVYFLYESGVSELTVCDGKHGAAL
ncbi:predicted protein [Pyrenophora tritici-repentis Pt-1C-BFP]|uniref:Uncharacterized protein n=1 Tax=Pyrenophora tritici-repentis (strain Pt-1C-BFP) TaxID=426418 RepID=B2WGQ7_PYRTR|nr:uncharacterized protein PTRG_09113 [Pyrenophora tritici-repentis Pt-1C-BFP]EDU42164.1 predicted protein [Pyrenophora tritici-repentis Pt-1C-BFP]